MLFGRLLLALHLGMAQGSTYRHLSHSPTPRKSEEEMSVLKTKI